MWTADVLTYWITTNGRNMAAVTGFLSPGDSAVDATGQPTQNIDPDPNLVVFSMRCDESTLDAIEADADHAVLSLEEIVEEELEPQAVARAPKQPGPAREKKDKNLPPSASERAEFRAHMRERGVSNSVINRIEEKATRGDVVDEVVKYCKGLPKKRAGRS